MVLVLLVESTGITATTSIIMGGVELLLIPDWDIVWKTIVFAAVTMAVSAGIEVTAATADATMVATTAVAAV